MPQVVEPEAGAAVAAEAGVLDRVSEPAPEHIALVQRRARRRGEHEVLGPREAAGECALLVVAEHAG